MRRLRIGFALALLCAYAAALLSTLRPAPPDPRPAAPVASTSDAFEEYLRLEILFDEASDLCIRMSSGSATARGWNRRRVRILKDAADLESIVEHVAGQPGRYPSSLQDLRAAVRSLRRAVGYLCWASDGRFAGAIDPAAAEWLAGPDGRPFSFLAVLTFLGDAKEAAARECARRIRKEAVRPEAASLHPEIGPLLDLPDAAPPRPDPPAPAAEIVLNPRTQKLEEARRILAEADRCWEEIADTQAPTLYRRLLEEFPETLRELQASARVHNRAGR
jgi:hypothetical protein